MTFVSKIEAHPTNTRDDNRYWNGPDAALGLAAAIRTLQEIDAEKGRWQWSMPDHERERQDEAVAQAQDAIRFLMSSEASA